MYNLGLLCQLAIGISSVYGTLPAYIHKCEAGNHVCLLKNINFLLTNKYDGDESLAFPSIKPIMLGNVHLKEESDNPVNIDISLTDAAIYGGRNLKGIKMKGFGKTPDGTHSLLLKGPMLYLQGKYSIDGKILILPIFGEGDSNITMINPQIRIDIEGISKVKNDKLYMDVKEITLDVVCDRIYFKMDNLFNGDKDLSDNMNAFLNENWLELFNEVKVSILNILHKPAFAATQAVFALTPYTDFIETTRSK